VVNMRREVEDMVEERRERDAEVSRERVKIEEGRI